MSKMIYNSSREMRELPPEQWPVLSFIESEPLKVWVSNDFMAVLYRFRVNGLLRLCVNRTKKNGKDWRDGITWDDLQRIKNECLGEDVWCIENYPSQDKLVNLSNQRHLFILDEPPEYRFPEEAYFSDDDIQASLNLIKKMLGKSDE